MKKRIIYQLIIILGLTILFANKIKAQEPDTSLYCIAFKQEFESYGPCSSDPDYEYARFYLMFDDAPYRITTIYNDRRDLVIPLSTIFYNSDKYKRLSNLKNASGQSLTDVLVSTYATDIRFDKFLNYDFQLNAIRSGEYVESHEASDPCNAFNKNRREGYIMTSTLIIDDPVYLSCNETYRYCLDYDSLAIKTDNYYDNGNDDTELHVAPAFTDDWEKVQNVIVRPGETIHLTYEAIAGRKENPNSNFFKWMGKPLQFRVVKTLLNNRKTTGNILSDIVFYPKGMEYDILQTKRSSCSTSEVSVYIDLKNDLDEGYFVQDPLFFWRMQSSSGLLKNCIMQGPTTMPGTTEPLVYEIIACDSEWNVQASPFDEPDQVEWTLQLEVLDTVNDVSSYACEKTFIIPPKPDTILVSQIDSLYLINGDYYDVLDTKDIYVMLAIDDQYDFAYLRQPYAIKEGDILLDSIENLSESYEKMSQRERDSIDDIFDTHFDLLTDKDKNPNNPYMSYFGLRYRQWFESHSTTIDHPLNSYRFSVHKYHSHNHSHSCSHTHQHKHTCVCIEPYANKDIIDEAKEGVQIDLQIATQERRQIVTLDDLNKGNKVEPDGYPACDNLSCTGHSVSGANPHNLCVAGHSHIEDSNPDWSYYENEEHNHSKSHSHEHTHTGIHSGHNHGSNDSYDYTVIRRQTLPGGTPSNFSSAYNSIKSVSLVTSDFKAEYLLTRSSTNVTVSIWHKGDILNNVYPDQGIAGEWYDTYKALYKKFWLAKRFGIKISNGIRPDQPQHLKLVDGDGCEYPFDIYVKTPPIPDFDSTITKEPDGTCAKNGTAWITYRGGGSPPYYHASGTLDEVPSSIVVGGLEYGPNKINFTDEMGNLSATYIIVIGSETDGITDITPLPQTCTPANGSISITVGNLDESKTYRLINEKTHDTITHTTPADTWTFPGLKFGKYTAEVETATCFFDEDGIEVKNEIFSIIQPIITTNASVIGGLGTVTITFDNRVNDVDWISGVPPEFNPSENSNTKYYPEASPGIYNYYAEHEDAHARACTISGTFTVSQPSFDAEIVLEENEDSILVLANLREANSLLLPYRFRLLNSSGGEIDTGSVSNAFSSSIKSDGTYTINLVYGSENIDLNTFKYPSTSITNGYSVTHPTCPGGSGSITLTPSGGIDGTDLTISTNGVTFDNTKTHTVQPGDFTYYIKDEKYTPDGVHGNPIAIHHSLINSFTVPINDPDPVDADIIRSIDISCAGVNDGRVSIGQLSGGSGSYLYRVDNEPWTDTINEITGLAPGNHTVYLRDNINPCPIVTLAQFEISEPDTLKIDSVRIIQPKCELDNGEIYVEVQGGNGFYKFDWEYNNNAYYSTDSLMLDTTTHLGDSLRYGFYRLNVEDNSGCTLAHNIELEEYFNPQIDSIYITDARCFGDANGIVQVASTSGTTNISHIALRNLDFSYNDTIYGIANSFDGLLADKYELIAVDDSSCTSDVPYPAPVGQPEGVLYAIIDTIVPVIEKGTNTGQIHTTVYGGNDSLKTISLLDSDNVIIEQQFERSLFTTYFDSLYAGLYSIQITDKKGCAYNTSVQTVTEPTTNLGFNIIEKNDARCKAQTGSFTIEGYGGWGEYSYKRATDNGYYKINTFENLYAGSYVVSVRDKFGAVFTDTLVIYEPKDSLQASLIDNANPTCGNNGSVTLNLNGGVAPYQLFFDNSSDTTEIAVPQDFIINNRPAGGYLLHIQDDNGCKFELETYLSDQELLEIVDFDLTYPSASGASNGRIEAFVTGGESPLNFSWRDFFGNSLTETTSVLSNIPSGHYELTVSEQDGCSQSKRIYLSNISDVPLEIIDLQHETSYLAQNGYAQLYSDLDSLVNVEVIDPQGTRTIYNINDSTSGYYENNSNIYLINLVGGDYFVMASNSMGEQTYTEFEIESYEQFYFDDIQISHAKEINDSSGTITIVVAGGAGKNTFEWEYLDGVINNLDTTNSEYTCILQNAIAGNYRVTVTDRFNNIITQDFLVEQPATPLDISISEYRNESCKDYEDAYVILQATGGWGDYQFKQDVVEYYSNSDTWLNLDVRQHYFYLTDKMGVIDSVAINITEPDYLQANVAFIDSVDCKNASDGLIYFNVTGGTQPYRFARQDLPAFWTQDTIAQNLPEGSYSYIFTDSNNCVGQDTVIAYMPEPDSLLFSIKDVTHTTCNTDNGTITVAMQGGTSPYRYEWTDFAGNILGSEHTISELRQSSSYTLNVLDVHNCMQQYEQFINPSTNPIVVAIDTTRVLCHGGNTGTASIIEVTPAVPFAPYSFLWSNEDIGEYSEGYSAGIHSVTISDTNNCSTVKYFEVTEPDTLQITVSDFKDAHCFGYNDGFIEIHPSGGVGNHQITWSNGENTSRIESLYSGIYSVTLTDSNLCSIKDTFEVIEPMQLIVDLGDDISICPGNTITIDGQDFTTHQWSNADGVISDERYITIDAEDTYFLEVTNSIGCFAHDEISLTIGSNALKADFLMTSESYLGDTIFIYEISNIQLDSLFWDYNPTTFYNITDDSLPDYMLHLESNEIGIHNIGLWAYSGGCISTIIKQIEIIEENDTTIYDDFLGYTDPLILELEVYPNPTDGNFTLKVKLREMTDILVTLFNINHGTVVNLREEYGQDLYEVDYYLNELNTGVYLIMVTANNERKQIKILIE